MKFGKIVLMIGVLEIFLAAIMLLLSLSEWTTTLIVSLIGLLFIIVGFTVGKASKE